MTQAAVTLSRDAIPATNRIHGPGAAAAAAGCAVDRICRLAWHALDRGELLQAALAYYYFSVQFRENLEIACRRHPADRLLRRLRAEECDTDNLSPWPGIAGVGERLDHDEFMRRLLALQPIAGAERVARAGERYLAQVRGLADATRARSIASYEDGGLSSVFGAMLRAPDWRGRGPQAFRFFLEQHIKFDSDESGHGALSRHLAPDDGVAPLWDAFHDLLVMAAPKLRPADAALHAVRPALLLPAQTA